ncbi:MAG: alpha/beta hydrolase [Anaerolineae bacterium]|nr:alpha/beta hydrolase [Anaerolineae bacterium]
MKLSKVQKVVVIGIAVIAIIPLGMIVWAKTGTYEAGDTALAALESSETVTVTQDQWIVFDPADDPEIGLIFYPGGLVEPGAYAPVLHQIAEEGVLVVITPMPLNLAILNTNAASSVIDAYSDISSWILAGHSLGGAAAAIYAENNPESISALVFWDSYPPESADLSDNDIPVLSIYGTMDGTPNTDNFDARRHLVPGDTMFIGIEGANHARFGDYGPQKGDVAATISMDEQHDIVVDIMLDFIDRISSDTSAP